MEPMGPMILGLPLEVFLMLASGVFYILCAGLLWKPFRQEKNELIGALLAFLVYQAISMIFMGLEMLTMNMTYSNIASLAVLIGSAYMLKFPFSSFSKGTRRLSFLISLILVLTVFAWFMQTEAKQMSLMNFALWYDIIVNGIVVGGFMIILAVRTSERVLRLKAFGGGAGVVSCCVVANATMIGGAIFASTFFQFIAPIIILGTLFFARARRRKPAYR